eukprot:TRINITY_DN12420_c1_g6_i1.p3 TRINITY_DN12420_c1_g6~~TRINITY_DN12420_c1_g6_i1.p3  ORF type:complete len:119 (-),score=18.22 TRINITY_DN12420_c1_g6_i1:741-1097(-)
MSFSYHCCCTWPLFDFFTHPRYIHFSLPMSFTQQTLFASCDGVFADDLLESQQNDLIKDIRKFAKKQCDLKTCNFDLKKIKVRDDGELRIKARRSKVGRIAHACHSEISCTEWLWLSC